MAGSGVGGMQTINGQNFQMYSPEWYEAQRQNEVRKAGTTGKAAGTEIGSAFEALPPSLKALAGPGSSSYSASYGGGEAIPTLDSINGIAAGGSGSPAPLSPHAKLNLPDTEAAQSAIFARAKDQAAQTARASLDALAGELSSRGMGGAGYEASGIGERLSRSANTVGEVSRAQATELADTQAEAARTEYQGDITQRGQDMSAQEAAAQNALSRAQLALSGRGQEIGAREAASRDQMSRLDLILKALSGRGVSPSLY